MEQDQQARDTRATYLTTIYEIIRYVTPDTSDVVKK